MGKTLVVAEKPSVARDLAAALPGSFKQAKEKTHLVGDDHVITCAVSDLLALAEPATHAPTIKRWRCPTLPITPEGFKLATTDEPTPKHLRPSHMLMANNDRVLIANACDAG